MWKRIMSSREAILSGAYFKLGNGFSINFWIDPWVPWLDNEFPKLKQ